MGSKHRDAVWTGFSDEGLSYLRLIQALIAGAGRRMLGVRLS